MRWLDTNVIIRYLTRDDPVKAAAALVMFRRVASDDEQIRTCEAIISEVCYVLSARAHYNLTHAEIRARLVPIIALRGLKLPSKRLYLRALDIYAGDPALDFEDALSVAYMEREAIGEIYSWDTDFDRVPGVARVEP
jgi:predicted nucleic acid-binding protein